ncbi:MAG: PD-(D/E)XK nuclease family protein, partial [Ornithinimicrobium sp.]
WSTGKKPRVTSRFLADVIASPNLAADGLRVGPWADMPTSAETPNPLAALENTASWPGLPGRRRAAVIDLVATAMSAQGTRSDELMVDNPAGTVADPEVVQMLLAERSQRLGTAREGLVVDMPDIMSTSALLDLSRNRDGFLRRLRRPLPQPPSEAAEVGTGLHAWIEQHYARPTLWDHVGGEALEVTTPATYEAVADSRDSDTPENLAEYTVESGELEQMQRRFLSSSWADQRPVAIELAVTTHLAGRTIRGRIDAVFKRSDGGYTVVDWKSGQRPGERELAHRAMQLEVYRMAYARLHKVPTSMVDGAFYFAATGETVWPELAMGTDFEAKIEAAFAGDSS